MREGGKGKGNQNENQQEKSERQKKKKKRRGNILHEAADQHQKEIKLRHI
jgi:hypothetical protein